MFLKKKMKYKSTPIKIMIDKRHKSRHILIFKEQWLKKNGNFIKIKL